MIVEFVGGPLDGATREVHGLRWFECPELVDGQFLGDMYRHSYELVAGKYVHRSRSLISTGNDRLRRLLDSL